MRESVIGYSGRRFALTVALPALGIAAALAIGAFLLLQWSVQAFDTASVARQKDLVGVVVGRLRADIAHQQESSTVWDDAVRAMRDPPSPDWIDLNLGSWMHTYFGHDAVFIVDSTDVPIFASESGEHASLDTFAHIAAPVARLLAEVREKMRTGDISGQNLRTVSPGASDFVFDEGRPAIVSLKPIVSDSGTIEQTPGTEYIHISMRYLDGGFLTELSDLYLFDDLHFALSRQAEDGLESYPVRSNGGEEMGYFVWRPYRPGSEVLRSITPVIVGILAALVASVAGAVLILHRRRQAAAAHQASLHHFTHHDSLTGLPNRHELRRRLDTQLAIPEAAHGAMLIVDLDHFKAFNDVHGHTAGDEVLRQVALRIAALVPERIIVGRVDSDEFGIVAPGHGRDAAEALAQAILDTLRTPLTIGADPVFVGVSIGIALFPEHGVESTELLRKTGVALHRAKSEGRGRLAVFDTALGALLLERTEIEQDLRVALRDFSQISVFYQPIYRANDRKLVAAEALARWNHPTRGWVSPAQFVPIAEDSNLIKRLGAHVLLLACRAALDWPLETIAVNVSAIQLRDPGFVGTVEAALAESGLPAQRLELEITESAWTEDDGQCTDNLRGLRGLGVRIALDDFGTGFSTFGRLHKSETVDRLKIDQSFIKGSGQAKGDKAIVRAIVDLARAKGIRTTAEGVETLEAAEFLTRIGCDELQGFLFSRPLPHADADALIGALGEAPMLTG